MAILATLIDKVSAVTLGGLTLTTYPHSLPATNPEAVLFQPRSYAGCSAFGQLYSPGGNASLLTVGLAWPSLALASVDGVVSFNAWSFVFHSVIR